MLTNAPGPSWLIFLFISCRNIKADKNEDRLVLRGPRLPEVNSSRGKQMQVRK